MDRAKTIDSKGNIIDKPYGVSRWANPKRYACKHDGCPNQAKMLSTKGKAHNCCKEHPDVHD